ncbi:dihydrofolate reductase family protein [Brachybacterium sacelli]|uniref:Dihydrofolate reductase n=1 Tax=Brachybacterium sacelli TaxID=173364 RepID=A0ABS4X0S2_9MICO|nr:dihydrofolate reductase family protein [Brachybacterium sacelli]MBP2382062.1 dihydrofolate reductase [Brachybacterium sacelli]
MGKVAWGFTASLDGFIAGPRHDMRWLEETAPPADGATEAMAAAVGVIISGRAGYDAARAQAEERGELTAEAYGGAWEGTEIVLTHRPEEIAEDPAIVPMDCDVREAVRRAQEIAGEGDVQIISADIARQALEHDLVDELQMFVAPVFLGDGTRIFDVPGGRRVDWELVRARTDSVSSWGRIFRPRRLA